MFDFVGADPDSPNLECPAVFVDPETGDFYQQGKVVTDPLILAQFARHSPLGADEGVVWQPARMAPILAEAAAGTYETGRQGHGAVALMDMIRAARHSVAHLEMRDAYDTAESAFLDWTAGRSGANDMKDFMADWMDFVASIVGSGVRMRRARIVSEPLSDYIRWEHALTVHNVDAGEDVRWLPRRQAYDLMLPGADLWLIDSRLVAFNFNAGNGASLREYEFVSDPKLVAPVVMAFEQVWDRATPHADYQP